MQKTPATERTLELFGWPHSFQGSDTSMPKPSLPPTADSRAILEIYSACFTNAYGRPPVLTPKLRAMAKSMANTVDAETARTAIENAFADRWFVQTAGGEFSAILGQINKWLITTPGKVAAKPATQTTTTRRTGLPDY